MDGKVTMSVPEVSVVSSIYNGERYLRESLESVLDQKGVDAEIVVVNDGSSDATAEILEEYAAKYPQLRVIHQKNAGLTRALAVGCSLATGEYIARHDLDDIARQSKLAKQAEVLRNRPDVALVSCWSRFIGPEGEELYTVARDELPEEATARIRAADINDVRGIAGHGSAMFRRADYERAGGYRYQFYYAQDLDLWRRITDFGMLYFVPEVLYEPRWDNGTISADKHAEQIMLKSMIVELSKIRQEGGDETGLLAEAEKIRPGYPAVKYSVRKGHGYYYLGRVLQRRRDPNARKYLMRALAENPLHWRAAFALLFGHIAKGTDK